MTHPAIAFSDIFWILSRWEAIFRALKWETPVLSSDLYQLDSTLVVRMEVDCLQRSGVLPLGDCFSSILHHEPCPAGTCGFVSFMNKCKPCRGEATKQNCWVNSQTSIKDASPLPLPGSIEIIVGMGLAPSGKSTVYLVFITSNYVSKTRFSLRNLIGSGIMFSPWAVSSVG